MELQYDAGYRYCTLCGHTPLQVSESVAHVVSYLPIYPPTHLLIHPRTAAALFALQP